MTQHAAVAQPRQLPDGRMNAPAAAAYLGLTIKTLTMYRWRGTGPRYVKLGRIFYFKSDLDAWIAKRSQG